MTIRAAIVDDEPLAREWLRTLLADDPDIEVVAEYADGASASAGLREARADLVFLDIQMPERDGFDVLAALGDERPPLIVFVTAYDQYAIRAFEAHALDYLLKPFDRARFVATLARAKAAMGSGERGLSARLAAFVAQLYDERTQAGRIAIRSDGRVTFVNLDTIDWIEADDNQVRLHVGRGVQLLSQTLSHLEERLPARQFLRVHRSAIVNTNRVREIQPLFHGEHVLLLHDGTRITVGRKYKDAVRQILATAL